MFEWVDSDGSGMIDVDELEKVLSLKTVNVCVEMVHYVCMYVCMYVL